MIFSLFYDNKKQRLNVKFINNIIEINKLKRVDYEEINRINLLILFCV